jgi:hypothetical protein
MKYMLGCNKIYMSQVSTTAYTNELSCSMHQYGTFQHAIQKYH